MIYFIMASNAMAMNMCSAIIGDRTPDHAFISVEWRVKADCSRCRVWQVNNILLETSGVEELVNRDILEFYSWNQGLAGTAVMWDACKAYLRGSFIAIKAFRDRERDLIRANVLSEIHRVEAELKQRPLGECIARLHVAYDGLNFVDVHKIAQELLYGKQKLLEYCNKLG